MYVAVKGGEAAILATHDLLAEARRGDNAVPELSTDQIREQLGLAVARVMNEGSLYDPRLAALALKQAQGDAIEAAFLIRAWRTTLARFGSSLPLDTAQMAIRRRVSATYKDLPGGQVLGPTYDYTHRLLDFSLAADASEIPCRPPSSEPLAGSMPRVPDILGREGLMESEVPPADDGRPFDLTRDPVSFPAGRDVRLQSLARGDEGFLLGLAYSVQRGFGGNHPFAGEIRMGEVAVEIVPDELGFAIDIGDITVTECQMVNQFTGSADQPPQFTRGYGLVFGHAERKAMSMSIVDRALKGSELGEAARYPAQQEEFVLYHADNVEAAGFVEHLKLPHYVDFQGELELIRKLRRELEEQRAGRSSTPHVEKKEGAE
ncbi:MAG: carbon-phosphorus lyase complex subunit PhnI [Hyphomicrobiaceae bacterium]|nr:carbon-phosphorus lyase complex subunit PhnI [Hyphomicrobiaceae bacterium]